MYDVKEVINRMKIIANISSNINLAKSLNVSYNTFNTWLKRKKLPQEIIFSFCKKYNCSLDYLLLNKKFNDNKESNSNISDYEVKYYGNYDTLNITYGQLLKISPTLLHSNGLYLLKMNEVFFIAKISFNPFEDKVFVTNDNINIKISFEKFVEINQGLITNI